MRFFLIILLAGVLCAGLEIGMSPDVAADSIILKNGSTLNGTARRDGERVIVEFGQKGRIILKANQVLEIVTNDRNDFEKPIARPEPATASNPVIVTLKSGASGPYLGYVMADSDDRLLVLEIPDAGSIRIRRSDIDKIEEVTEPAERPAPATKEGEVTSIATTHLVHLKNGNKLRGNIIETTEDEPYKLKVGNMGVMAIPRREVEKVESAAGRIELTPASETEVETQEPPSDDDILDEIKTQIRQEILRELLESLIDRKLDAALDLSMKDLSLKSIADKVPEKAVAEIRNHVQELGRQRNTNRVRAEDALRRLGNWSLPFLAPSTNHSFNLTRRAIQRLIRDIGDIRGIPMAIQALTDEDYWVRQHAIEALRKLLGRTHIPYDPAARVDRRLAAQNSYQEYWKAVQKQALEEAMSAQL